LILVALLAVILGYSVSRFAKERAAVEAILARGGKVTYFDKSYGPVHPERTLHAWFREFAGLRWPGYVHLEGKGVTNDVLRDEVLPLRTVEAIGLSDVAVTNEGLAQLRSLESLLSVSCLRDRRNGRVLDALYEPSEVDMQFAPVDDAMDYFADLHGITITFDTEVFRQLTDSSVVTCTLKNQPFSVILDRVLEPLDFGWIVANGWLYITTPETAKRHAREIDAVRASLPQLKTLVIDTVR
jgi:hypothetical protein